MMQWVYKFVFHYPLLMAFTQIIGTIIYILFRERNASHLRELKDFPLVSILVPCHNEEHCIRETMRFLFRIDYPNYEIIAINDGSKDRTLEVLRGLQNKNSNLRILTMSSNQGKGMGLTLGALFARGEFLVCIDADALLDPKVVKYFMWHFVGFPRVGAVTGNPRVRNRTSILGKIQVGEFSSIVSMIKRTQRVLGKIFTVSGVIAAFRKRALLHAGFWSNDMVTEDIDVSWKLQTEFWDIRYEPHALCWILMPETLRGLLKQRFRWAQGGSEVLRKFAPALLNWEQRRIWPIYLEYLLSVIWAYSLLLTVLIFFLGKIIELPSEIVVRSVLPGWTGLILSFVCLLQIAIGLIVENKFEPRIYRLFFWLIWYPLLYWLINASVTIFAFPKAMFKKMGQPAVWESPDRGLR